MKDEYDLSKMKSRPNPYLTHLEYSTLTQRKGQKMAEEIRRDLKAKLDGSLEDFLSTLRGRFWSLDDAEED